MTHSNVMKATNEQILQAYALTGSVWKAAKALGMGGQTVHARLVALGQPVQGGGRTWTPEEVEELRSLAEGKVAVFDIASRLDRSYAAIACKMNELNIGVGRASKHKKVPRGLGYTKVAVARHLKAMIARDITITRYCVENSLDVNLFVTAAQSKLPELWAGYLTEKYAGEAKKCVGCDEDYIPTNGKQRFCTRSCSTRTMTDERYFGGKRSTTVGLAERICQLCTKHIAQGISSHHVLGKQNDPENDFLVALCRGCHQIVTLLGCRDFIDVPERWEALILLTRYRKHGANPPQSMSACVEIEDDDDDLEDDVTQVQP